MNRAVLDKLSKILKKEKAAALMIAPSADMWFLVNNAPYLCERFQAMVIKDDGDYFYICNLLTVDEAAGFMEGHPVYGWSDGEDFTEIVKSAFEKQGLIGKTIAVNDAVRACNICAIQQKINVRFIDGKGMLHLARIIKNPQELGSLRKASGITDRVFEDIVRIIKPGMTEREIQETLFKLAETYGGVPNGKGGLVAVGTNAALPHYFAGDRVVSHKDIVQMDYGCSVDGFRSDMTRTVFVGEPTEREKYIYHVVLEANLAGEEAVRNGAYIPDIDRAARRVIEKAGFGQYFTHRLGHGIGYAGHEEPTISEMNKMYLQPGMAFSIEPGIYIKDEIGVRIEDIVIINEKGEKEILNTATKEMVIINV